MDIATVLTNPITYLILLGLAVACTAYAWLYVRRTRRKSPHHGQTALFVVIGSAIVGIAYTIGLAASYGIPAAIAPAIFLLLCYIAAGIPMIVEYIDDHTDSAGRQQTIDNINRIMEEE